MGRIIGIDLGTTNSGISFMDGEEPKIIPNDRGNRITPSVVAFTEKGEILIGEAAKNQAVINAEGTILSVKRYMGSDHIFNLKQHGVYSPEEISSFILKKLKKDAETFLGEEVTDAVITVPAYFKENQRKATREAGRLAGLNVKRIINEPTAAALAYAYSIKGKANILVYDLGGGTFDVTYLSKENNRFTVQSSRGKSNLGGIDFDNLLLGKVLDNFSKECGIDISTDKILMQQLRDQVERAKIELTSRENALIALPFITASNKPLHLQFEITRREFEALIEEFIGSTVELSLAAIRDAGAKPENVERLILSGGSSKIPLVRSMLSSAFKLEPEKKINPEEVVALGAAIQASMLTGEVNDIVLTDITPFSFVVEIEGGKFVKILQANTRVPARKSRIFTTISDNQRSVEINILQGESENASENTSLGRFLLSGIRDGKRGEPRIEVIFSIDADGILLVKARDIDTKVEQKITINSAFREYDEISFKEKISIKNRVTSLVNRVSALSEKFDGFLDRSFKKEIGETIRIATKAIVNENVKELSKCLIILETLIGELNSLCYDEEAGEYEQA